MFEISCVRFRATTNRRSLNRRSSSDGGGPVTTWARDCAATIVNIISPTNGEELSHSLVEFVIDAYGFKSGDADKTGGIGHVRDPASQSHP
jgi:hypothetical protein